MGKEVSRESRGYSLEHEVSRGQRPLSPCSQVGATTNRRGRRILLSGCVASVETKLSLLLSVHRRDQGKSPSRVYHQIDSLVVLG